MPVYLDIQSRKKELKQSREKLLRFAKLAREATGLRGTVSILVESDERMRAMNRYFRHKDKSTDVLSFPAASGPDALHSGDIAISADIAVASARRFGHRIEEEIKVLILHGMLHLAGHDHETDSGKMAKEECRLRAELHLPHSLIARSAKQRASESKRKAEGPAKKPYGGHKTARIKVRMLGAHKAGKSAASKKRT